VTRREPPHAVQTLSKMPAMLADIEENMDATLRRCALQR
jgi:hypothetical protein